MLMGLPLFLMFKYRTNHATKSLILLEENNKIRKKIIMHITYHVSFLLSLELMSLNNKPNHAL